MSNQAPTLFDDFFLDDEPPQNDRPVKKTNKKKKEKEQIQLFGSEEGQDNPQETANGVSHSQDEKIEGSETEDTLIVAEKGVECTDHEELTVESHEEDAQEISDDDNGTVAEGDAVSEMKIEGEVEMPSIVTELTEDPGEELQADQREKESADEMSRSDMDILSHQYIEEIDFFSRPDNLSVLNNSDDTGSVQKADDTHIVGGTESEIDAIESFVPNDWDLKKHYYSIGEVANMFGVNISHIRFWSNEFKLNPRTNKKGNRFYTPKQIETLQLINYLVKEKKHTIKGAQEKLKAHKKLVQNNMLLKDSLISLKSKLEELKNQF